MFAKFSALFVASALVSGVMSAPAYKNALVARGQSFDNWNGISSLSGFDNFYGSDDFAHHSFNQVVVDQGSDIVCHSEQVTIIQQRLAVLQEMAKKIITEQICEVETQTVVFQQYYASLGGFSSDLTRNSGRHVGYDSSIVSHYGDFYNSDGSLSNYDFGFSGSDIGSNYCVPSNNWNSNTSPSSVGSAYQAAQVASWY
ncbi:Amidohydro-rel domain-containing protein [Mycena sanguinolenta]|uniref:Amidohydro-rel domain-containing protein n=1 Tax=Mycena sanguinolenta TaxID=230812 RepID=A0A8H7CWZ5_9AGAR|nr:Amidohydro-rel domain-containing protein [Mycena sanguinolenta]